MAENIWSPGRRSVHAQAMAQSGADIIDIGAASSHPDAQAVAPEMEIARLEAVVPALKAKGLSLSIDSFATPVQRWALAQGVDYLNDIHGFPDAALYPELAEVAGQADRDAYGAAAGAWRCAPRCRRPKFLTASRLSSMRASRL